MKNLLGYLWFLPLSILFILGLIYGYSGWRIETYRPFEFWYLLFCFSAVCFLYGVFGKRAK